MRNKNLYSILWAVMALLAAALACNVFNTTPGASNFYMAKDEQGQNRTTTFAPTDDFFLFFDVNAIEPSTKFQARWYGLDLEGQDPNTPVKTMDYTYEEGASKLYFQLSPLENWPAGNYKVEVYMNNVKAGEQAFRVQ